MARVPRKLAFDELHKKKAGVELTPALISYRLA
jgi:hypothetical protein